VSGLTFEFDPKLEPGKRIPLESIKINGVPMELEKNYTVATKQFMCEGNDRYAVLRQGKYLNDEETAEEIRLILKRFFGKRRFGRGEN